MLTTVIIAGLAGAATPLVEPHVARILGDQLGEDMIPDRAGINVASFGVMMLAASVLLALADSDGGHFWLILGGLAGYFQEPLRKMITRRMG